MEQGNHDFSLWVGHPDWDAGPGTRVFRWEIRRTVDGAAVDRSARYFTSNGDAYADGLPILQRWRSWRWRSQARQPREPDAVRAGQ